MKKLTKKQIKKILNTKVKPEDITKEDIELLNELNKIKGVTATLIYPHELLALGYTETQIAELQNKKVLIID